MNYQNDNYEINSEDIKETAEVIGTTVGKTLECQNERKKIDNSKEEIFSNKIIDIAQLDVSFEEKKYYIDILTGERRQKEMLEKERRDERRKGWKKVGKIFGTLTGTTLIYKGAEWICESIKPHFDSNKKLLSQSTQIENNSKVEENETEQR